MSNTDKHNGTSAHPLEHALRYRRATLPDAHAHLATAWDWLCAQRENAPADADIWHLRRHWPERWESLLTRLLLGQYRLSPMQLVGQGDDRQAMWGAEDALVLKWVALHIAPLLPLHARCEHVKGHGGGKASIARLSGVLQQGTHPWVYRTDVKGYYANIDKPRLLDRVNAHVLHPVLQDLVAQYVHYTVEDGGTFHTPQKGISRGCALSPLMGALYLREVDEHFAARESAGLPDPRAAKAQADAQITEAQTRGPAEEDKRPRQFPVPHNGIVYARYMDDIVILARSRRQLKKHVRHLNMMLNACGLHTHPDKTFVGRTVKGFDWLGAWLTPDGVADVAPRAKANHQGRLRRLYERAWRRREPKGITAARVSAYRLRWTIWAMALGVPFGCGADELSVVVRSGTSGFVGATDFVQKSIAPHAVNWSRSGSQWGFPTISFQDYACGTRYDPGVAGRTTSGKWGYLLDGPTAGAVVTVDGTGSWDRNIDGWASAVHGTVLFQDGVWKNSWGPVPGGDPTSSESTPEGLSGADRLNCPVMDTSLNYGKYKYVGTSSVSVNVRFAVYAPWGGLSPGRYRINAGDTLYLGDYFDDAGSNRSVPLLTGLNVTVANYSCALTVDRNSVALGAKEDGAGWPETINFTANCGDAGGSQEDATYYLTAEATGVSSGTSTSGPRALKIWPAEAGSDNVIYGNWGTTAPTCNNSNMFFDGRTDGSTNQLIGTITPGGNLLKTIPATFATCTSGLMSGEYYAQATFRIVGR